MLRFVIACVIAALLLGSLFFSDRIEAALGWNTPLPERVGEGELKVHFIDVGQADSCVIELPDERKMIIDGGDKDAADDLLDYLDDNIFDGKEGKFDFAILTHSDSDHCGSLDDVISRYPSQVFYRPNQVCRYKDFSDPGVDSLYGDYTDKNTKVYKEVIEAAYENCENVVVTDATNDEINLITPSDSQKGDPDYYEINFYTPTKSVYKDVNDYSPIIILEYAGKRVALSGDAEKENESEFVGLAAEGKGKFSVFDENFTVDVIKLGHHGSDTSSSKAYLDALTTPGSCSSLIAVISCGAGNSYGHPKPEVLERLENMGVKKENIYRTDLVGDILVTLKLQDGKAVVVVNEKEVVANTAFTLKSWKTAVVVLIIMDFAVIIVLPEIFFSFRRTKRKRR